MTDQTDTVARRRRALIVVGVLLLALCAGGAYLALKGGKTGGATLGGYDDMTKEEIQAELDAIVYDFPLEVGTLVAVDENLATREINHAHASIRTARSTSVPMRHSPR